jgi:tetratricopeptide (TPR) repeat protein
MVKFLSFRNLNQTRQQIAASNLLWTLITGVLAFSILAQAAFAQKFPKKGQHDQWLRANAYFERANEIDKQGRVDDAIFTYNVAIKIYPYDSRYYFNLANTYKKQSKFKEAERAYLAAISADPHFTPAYLNLANLYQRQGDYKDAEAIYLKALKTSSKSYSADLNHNLAVLYAHLGNFDLSKHYANTAVKQCMHSDNKEKILEFARKLEQLASK